MADEQFGRKIYSYVFYVFAIIIFFTCLLLNHTWLVLISSVLLLLAALYFNSGHIINNILIRKSKIIEVAGAFKLSTETKSVFRKLGSKYASYSVAILSYDRGYNFSQEAFASFIMSIDEPFEFSIALEQLDTRKLMENIETKIRMKELSLKKIGPAKYDQISRIKRDIEILNNELGRLRDNNKNFNLIMRLKSYAESYSGLEAARASIRNLEKLCVSFSSSLGVGYRIVEGEELLGIVG
jgi:hypothetical protein